MNPYKVYIAGPYSSGDTIQNIRYAIEIGDVLFKYGFIPFIPHLTGFWHMLFPHDYESWMKYDSEWLKSCDALLRLPGESSGADREVSMATILDIPVFYDTTNLVQYFREK